MTSDTGDFCCLDAEFEGIREGVQIGMGLQCTLPHPQPIQAYYPPHAGNTRH